MATTTNYGWTTPDDTDLVKDGASAIRTLGSAIDTSLVDLRGGTSAQFLAKASNTDMDFTWRSTGQVVTATASLNQTTTSTTFVDVTSMSATITPTSTNSRILVNFSFQGGASGAANGVATQAFFQVVRTSTGIYTVSPYIYSPTLSNELLVNNAINMLIVDSPATTSAITYKLQAREDTSGTPSAVYIGGTGVIILTEILS
jgi:hypothetical protein